MLYRFSVENFKSFKERSEISFIPHQDTVRHVADVGSDVPVLRAAVIYGANASGKSNFIKAIDFAQDFILDNRKLQEGTNQAYRLDAEGVRTPSVFTFEIKVEEDMEWRFLSKESRKLVLTELAQKEMEADGFNEHWGGCTNGLKS